MLDNPWKIAALVGVLVVLRIIAGAVKDSTQRAFWVELFNSSLIAFALVFLLIRPLLLQAFFIPSGSMEPTLHAPDPYIRQVGDRILVNKFIYRLGAPRRGDIVVFSAPDAALYDRQQMAALLQAGSRDYIKRVVGLSGDRIQIFADQGVYINGQLLDEPYINAVPSYNWPPRGEMEMASPPYLGTPTAPSYVWPGDQFGKPFVVPPGNIFVLGDNRNDSNDAHLWRDPTTGVALPALPLSAVEGRSLFIFWPLNRLGRLTQ